jgi:hypothetical protein
MYCNGNKTEVYTTNKHIAALKYHHFKKYVESGETLINYIHTEMQQADILTKPVKIELSPKLQYMLMGW